MGIRKFLENLKERKKVSIERSLEKTVNEIIKVENEENPDRYYLMRLNKQYDALQKSAKKIRIETNSYENKLNEFYENDGNYKISAHSKKAQR